MQAFLASINWDSFGVPLGFLGGALAVGLACCGSARGVGMVGQAGAGLLSVAPQQVLPGFDSSDFARHTGPLRVGGLVPGAYETGPFFR